MGSTFSIETEKELVQRLKRREQAAMTELYDRYSAAIYGVILRIVVDEAVGQDKLQEVFIKIWKKIEQFDAEKGRLFTWLINIARNHAIDYTRSKEYQSVGKVQKPENFVNVVDRRESTTMSVDHIGLEKVISGLDPDLRLIIDYLYFQGYTQAELAEEKGIPLGTVKTRLKIAIRELRKLLN